MIPLFKIEIIDHNDILLYEYIAQDQNDTIVTFYKLKNDYKIISKYDHCIMQLLAINSDETYKIIKITNILKNPNQTPMQTKKQTNMYFIIFIIYLLLLPILLVKSAIKSNK